MGTFDSRSLAERAFKAGNARLNGVRPTPTPKQTQTTGNKTPQNKDDKAGGDGGPDEGGGGKRTRQVTARYPYPRPTTLHRDRRTRLGHLPLTSRTLNPKP